MLLLTKVDLFGTPANLNIFGNPKKKSNFGGFCSILFFGFVVWAVYNGARKLFDRDIPTIVSSNLTTEDPRRINFSSEAFPMAFIVQAPLALGNAGFKNASIYSLQVQLDMLERIPLPNGTIQKKWTYTKLETEPCTKEYFEEYASSFNTFTFQGSYCISKNQPAMRALELKGVYASALFKSLRVQVVACDPNKTNVTGVTCGTTAEINKYLAGSTFSVMYLNNVMHLQNYSYPTAKFRDTYSAMMSPAYYKETAIEIGYVEVSTDAGWLTETPNKMNTLQINKITESFDPTAHTDKVIMACLFQSGRIENYYTRTYIKLPAVLAEIGGLANAVLAIILILITPYLKIKSREALMYEIFEVKEESKYNRKKNKQKNKEPVKPIDSTSKTVNNKDTDKGNDPEKESLKVIKSPGDSESPPSKSYSVAEKETELNTIKKVEEKANSIEKDVGSSGDLTSQHTFPSTKEKLKNSEHLQSRYARLSQQVQASLPIKEEDIAKNSLDTTPENQVKENIEDKNDEKLSKTVEANHEQKGDNNVDMRSNLENYTYKEEENDLADVELEIGVAMEVLNGDQIINDKDVTKKKHKPKNTHLRVWEYALSLVYTPKPLKQKIKLIEEGVKVIEDRLDVNHILQRYMPKPYLNAKIQKQTEKEKKNVTREAMGEEVNKEQFLQSYSILKKKSNKTDVDNRLLEVCSRKFAYI